MSKTEVVLLLHRTVNDPFDEFFMVSVKILSNDELVALADAAIEELRKRGKTIGVVK